MSSGDTQCASTLCGSAGTGTCLRGDTGKRCQDWRRLLVGTGVPGGTPASRAGRMASVEPSDCNGGRSCVGASRPTPGTCACSVVGPSSRVEHRPEVVAATLHFIEARNGHLLLHAGGSTGTDGRTVVVHGASGAGKTTLTTALVQAGLAYVTDETVCLDPDTLVIEPFPKPLTVKPGSQELLAHLAPPPDEVSEGSGNWQLPPGPARRPTTARHRASPRRHRLP